MRRYVPAIAALTFFIVLTVLFMLIDFPYMDASLLDDPNYLNPTDGSRPYPLLEYLDNLGKIIADIFRAFANIFDPITSKF